MSRDWRNEPMTPEEQDAWDEHEAFLAYRSQYEHDHPDAHDLNVAICNAIANLEPWED